MSKNISFATDYNNSTHLLCLFFGFKKLKELKPLDIYSEQFEEKLNDIQENFDCALEKWGKKIEKHTREDKLSLLERTVKSLVYYSSPFFRNDTHQEDQATYTQKFKY